MTQGVMRPLLSGRITGRLGGTAAGLCLLAAAAGCGADPAATDTPATGASPTGAPQTTSSPGAGGQQGHAHLVEQRGTLAAPENAQGAVTYNPGLAPVGAEMTVSSKESNGQTTVTLAAIGLVPDRGYAAHAHVNPCGPNGDAAGPHFQNRMDPSAGPDGSSTDPTYANPDNEIWFELQTNSEGAGADTATVPFVFAERAPGSVVIHAAPTTATAPGQAGEAGARVACLTVPFE